MRHRLAVISAVALVACSSAPKRSSASDPQCSGDRTVIVRNGSNRDVDVVAERKGSGTAYELGTVQPGRQEEITLPTDARRAYLRTPPEGRTTNVRGTADLRYGCRT